MRVIKSKNRIIVFTALVVSGLIIALYIKSFSTKGFDNKSEIKSLSYSQVVNSKLELDKSSGIYKSRYEGRVIGWKGKISSYYSQITGIKFCVIDQYHQNVDINKPCDWFWASSENIMNGDDIATNPSWDGKWVNYILKYYKVPFDDRKQFYNDLYTVTGIVDGIDCGVDSKCVPNIKIINIKNNI
jgi:hypothetical protein